MGYIRANISAMPRVKSDAERGATGVWLRTERLRREWTPDDVVRRLADLSYPIRVDYYRGLESGAQKPGPELLAVLKRLYGSEPSAVAATQPATDSTTAVLMAIEHQTDLLAKQWEATTALVRQMAVIGEGLMALIGEMQQDREEARGRADGFADALGLMHRDLGELLARTGDEHAPPRPRGRSSRGLAQAG